MKKKYQIFLIVVALTAITVAVLLKYINKPVNDFSNQTVAAEFTFTEVIKKMESDTASMNKLKDKLVGVHGNVKKIDIDSTDITLELGDTVSMSSIICQVDPRHRKDFANTKTGDLIKIKGIVTGMDDDLGLGITLQMKSCSLLK